MYRSKTRASAWSRLLGCGERGAHILGPEVAHNIVGEVGVEAHACMSFSIQPVTGKTLPCAIDRSTHAPAAHEKCKLFSMHYVGPTASL